MIFVFRNFSRLMSFFYSHSGIPYAVVPAGTGCTAVPAMRFVCGKAESANSRFCATAAEQHEELL
jgi:hypothetical protein